MRLTGGLRVLGILLLALMFGGAQAAAHGVGANTLAVQDDPVCTELVTDTGTPGVDVAYEIEPKPVGTPGDAADAVDEGIDIGTPDDTDVEIPGTPDADDGVEPADADVGDGTPAAGTPVEDVSGVLGEDGVLDPNDEFFLCQDVDGDGKFEIGVDINGNGTLEENEVVGTDENEDESLTTDETFVDYENTLVQDAVGEDGVLDESDEGYLSEDVGDDGTNEIGVDLDESGTLDGNEVLGTDENDDGVLTEDEFVPGYGIIGDDSAEILGEDEVFDANDDGYLREDVNADGTFEIGRDEDESGTLEDDEVLGSDVNNDEAIALDELDFEVAEPGS